MILSLCFSVILCKDLSFSFYLCPTEVILINRMFLWLAYKATIYLNVWKLLFWQVFIKSWSNNSLNNVPIFPRSSGSGMSSWIPVWMPSRKKPSWPSPHPSRSLCPQSSSSDPMAPARHSPWHRLSSTSCARTTAGLLSYLFVVLFQNVFYFLFLPVLATSSKFALSITNPKMFFFVKFLLFSWSFVDTDFV